jgi:hypothetical protein
MPATDHIWFTPRQADAAFAAVAAHFDLDEAMVRTARGRVLAGRLGHYMMRARWAICLSLAEINDRDAPDIAALLGFYPSVVAARKMMGRCLDMGYPDDAEWDLAVAAIQAAAPGDATRLAPVPVRPSTPRQARLENSWTRAELDTLRAGLARGESYAAIASRLPGRTRDAALGKAFRLGWSVATPGELSGPPEPAHTPSQTTHKDTLSGGLGRGSGTAQITGTESGRCRTAKTMKVAA